MQYNQHAPQLLGNEWVPIQQNNYVPDDLSERGYVFPKVTTETITQGAFGVADFGTVSSRNTAELLAVYPEAVMPDTGPIQEVILPVTGSVTNAGTISLINGASVSACLASPTDNAHVQFLQTGANPVMDLFVFFTATAFAGLLTNRRIVAMEVDYMFREESGSEFVRCDFGFLRTADPANTMWWPLPGEPNPVNEATPKTINFGEANILWRGASIPSSTETEIMPWNYAQLQRLDVGVAAASRMGVRVRFSSALNPDVGTLRLHYVVLRVKVCAENRLLVGGWHRRATGYPIGSIITNLRPPNDLNTLGASLTAGTRYGVTSCNVQALDVAATANLMPGLGKPPGMHAIRELSTLLRPDGTPQLDGKLIRRTRQTDHQYSMSDSHVIAQLTLHTAAAITADCHPFGILIGAPVYLVNNAVQKIDTSVAAGGSYRYVTFYVRRFGETADDGEQLQVDIVENPTAVAFLTVADFLELPEIVDGWRKVTLEFAVPVTIAAASTKNLRFSPPGSVTIGRQWQILGADGPSLAAGQAFGPATYGGATNALTWFQPNGTTALDPLSDLSFVLSMQPPTITGLTGEVGTVELDVCAPACGKPRCCTITGVSTVVLEWTPSTISAAGFLEYRVYRIDAAGGRLLVHIGRDQAEATFTDREIVAGDNEYEVVVVDQAGIESTPVSITVNVPNGGVTVEGGTCPAVGVLVFTSNTPGVFQASTLLSLAYPIVREDNRSPELEFNLHEADLWQFEDMYLRDYRVGFHPEERGGVDFAVTLLVSNHCDPDTEPVELENFHLLRDLAWAPVPYVHVRDTEGNFWYASVVVPKGAFVRVGRLYLARDVMIVQTTRTPAPSLTEEV